LSIPETFGFEKYSSQLCASNQKVVRPFQPDVLRLDIFPGDRPIERDIPSHPAQGVIESKPGNETERCSRLESNIKDQQQACSKVSLWTLPRAAPATAPPGLIIADDPEHPGIASANPSQSLSIGRFDFIA